MKVSIKRSVFLLIIFNMLTINLSSAQSTVIPFDSGEWQLTNAEVLEFDGKQALVGSAALKNVEFQDGIIEVDIYTT